jgi:hypothetical protein
MRPLLGDFLAAASEHLDAATIDVHQLPADVTRTVVKELSRLTSVMARCANAFVADEDTNAAYLDAQALAVLDARSALRHAAARMHAAASTLGNGSDDLDHPAAIHLASSTKHLSASHDLLQSHFTPGPSGALHGNSLWAAAIVSAPANAALTATMGLYAGRLAPWMLQLATPSYKALPAPARVAISTACRWLRIAEAAAWMVNCQPDAVADQAMLRAIPANVPPPRSSPRGGELMPELCAGAIATAERLRHLAHVPASRTGTARKGMAFPWRRTAQGAAITGHCTELILYQLAESAAEIPLPPTASVPLKEAAHAVSGAWAAWRAVAHEWDTFTTGRGATLTPIADAIGDLTLWAGRITYTDPAWIPARNKVSPLRTSAALAGPGSTINGVVAALHQVGDALVHIAAYDRENVRLAAADGDLYIPTRMLSADCNVPHRYIPALPAMVDALLTTYDTAIHAAMSAVIALDDLALTLDPQPAVFATLRTIAPLTTTHIPDSPAIPSGRSTSRPQPGWAEQALRRRGINEPALLARATEIDDATQDLITAATSPSQRRAEANRAALHALEAPSTRHQHPAHLAAKDRPPYTGSNTSLPRLVPINHPIRHQDPRRGRLIP